MSDQLVIDAMAREVARLRALLVDGVMWVDNGPNGNPSHQCCPWCDAKSFPGLDHGEHLDDCKAFTPGGDFK